MSRENGVPRVKIWFRHMIEHSPRINDVAEFTIGSYEIVGQKGFWGFEGFDYLTMELLCLGVVPDFAAKFQQCAVIVRRRR